MDKVAGIVAEFNPYHNGHQHLAAEIRRMGYATIVAVMSGNFVQRGTPAITDKRVRARAALLSGVDLVLELPLAYATAPAQRFALGAVSLLAATGCVDALAFGSECGDAAPLYTLAHAVDSPAVSQKLREPLAAGLTFAKARELAVAQVVGPSTAAHLAQPNNLLAVEYLRAARQLDWHPYIHTVARVGAAHDSAVPQESFASASCLRQSAGDPALLEPFVPAPAADVYSEAHKAGLYPASQAKMHAAMSAHLRRLSPRELAQLPDLSEGLENRLYTAIREASGYQQLEASLKTKRYTLARVRRLILAAYLGLTRQDAHTPIPYIRILGFNAKGRELLSPMKQSRTLPVHHSLARLRDMGGSCARFANLEALATDLYTLTLPTPRPCGYEYSASAVFL